MQVERHNEAWKVLAPFQFTALVLLSSALHLLTQIDFIVGTVAVICLPVEHTI